MIEFAKKSDYEEIKKLWQKTFGDTDEYVDKFLSFFGEYAVIIKEKKLLAMMFLLPVYSKTKKGRYVYCVAVDESERNKGFGKRLVEFAKDFIKNDEFLVLVPASNSLFSYYERLGFYNNTEVFVNEKFGDYEKISLYEYFNEREEFFKNSDFIRWDKASLENIKSLYNAEFIKNSEGVFMVSGKNVLEFLPINTQSENKKLFSMIYPKNKIYFNIAID